MSTLSLALYCEGPTDQRFFPILIQRASRYVLAQHEQHLVEVLPVDIINTNAYTLEERILQAASLAAGYHALIVHTDADNPTPEKALQERFYPGYELILQCTKSVCKDLLPIIPVYMTEAWMLADHEKLRKFLRTDLSLRNLGLSERAKQVESYRDPKLILNQVVRKVYPNQPQLWSRIMGELYAELAPQISLERLKWVPSYQQFVKDLADTLKKLNMIHDT